MSIFGAFLFSGIFQVTFQEGMSFTVVGLGGRGAGK